MRRSCAGTNRFGKPCRSWAVNGSDRCRAHAGADMRALGSLGGIASNAARRQRAKSLEVLVAERLEQEADGYVLRIRGAIEAHDVDQAIQLVKEACGVSRAQIAREEAILAARAEPVGAGWETFERFRPLGDDEDAWRPL